MLTIHRSSWHLGSTVCLFFRCFINEFCRLGCSLPMHLTCYSGRAKVKFLFSKAQRGKSKLLVGFEPRTEASDYTEPQSAVERATSPSHQNRVQIQYLNPPGTPVPRGAGHEHAVDIIFGLSLRTARVHGHNWAVFFLGGGQTRIHIVALLSIQWSLPGKPKAAWSPFKWHHAVFLACERMGKSNVHFSLIPRLSHPFCMIVTGLRTRLLVISVSDSLTHWWEYRFLAKILIHSQ